MAQPVTLQDHILAAAARVRAQQNAARQLAVDLAAERADASLPDQVEPPAAVKGA